MITHHFLQLLRDYVAGGLSIQDLGSTYLETMNHIFKEVWAHHTTHGGGHQSADPVSKDPVAQALKYIALSQQPAIRMETYEADRYNCSICDRPKLNHRCKGPIEEQRKSLEEQVIKCPVFNHVAVP